MRWNETLPVVKLRFGLIKTDSVKAERAFGGGRSSDAVSLMKITFRSTFVAMIFATMLLSLGCEKKTAVINASSPSTPGTTKILEAADLVGYDGKRLRKRVDGIREANEKHNQQLEKLSETGSDQ